MALCPACNHPLRLVYTTDGLPPSCESCGAFMRSKLEPIEPLPNRPLTYEEQAFVDRITGSD